MNLLSLVAISLAVSTASHASPKQESATASAGSSSILPITIDAVIATVDEQPITLQDLSKKLTPPRELTLSQLGVDQEARAALDVLIFEKLLQIESEKRNVRVSPEEVNSYMEEVAKRNNLNMSDFEVALSREGKNINEYKEQIRYEILKSRIAASYVRATNTVTDEEVDNYIKEHARASQNVSSNSQGSAEVKLSQIVLLKEKHSEDDAKKRFDEIQEEFAKGVSFEELAKRFSETPEGQEGGSLGFIAEKDLHSEIFDAIVGLLPGGISGIISSNFGYHIVKLEERRGAKASDSSSSLLSNSDAVKAADNETKDNESQHLDEISETTRLQVRKQLEQERLSAKMASFFESELPKLHTVEKKY